MDLTPVFQIVIAAAVMYVTQWVKRVQAVPINEGQKGRIRTFVASASFVLTLVTAYADGNLENVLSPDMIEVGLWSGVSFVLAHFGYQGFLKK